MKEYLLIQMKDVKAQMYNLKRIKNLRVKLESETKENFMIVEVKE